MAKDTKAAPKRRTVATTGSEGASAATKTAPRATTKKTTTLITPTRDQIRERAFQLFMARNGGAGDAHTDWVEAERQLTDELNR